MPKQTSTYRRLAVVLLGMTLCAPVLYSLYFYVERIAHHAYMWHEAKHEKLETFKADSASLQWTKKNRELILKGEYFDVVSIKYHNGKATIKGFFDNKETQMHKAFAAANEKKNGHDYATHQLANWLQTGWFGSHPDLSFSCPIYHLKPETGFKQKPLPLCGLNVPQPPPWHTV